MRRAIYFDRALVAAALALVALTTAGCRSADTERKEQELAERERRLAEKEQAVESARPALPSPPTPANRPVPEDAPRVDSTPRPRGRTVSVTVVLDAAPNKPNGSAWDGLGDAPDPVITIRVGSSGQELKSSTFKNVLHVITKFDGLRLAGDDTLSLTAVDADLAADDPMGTTTFTLTPTTQTSRGSLGHSTIALTLVETPSTPP